MQNFTRSLFFALVSLLFACAGNHPRSGEYTMDSLENLQALGNLPGGSIRNVPSMGKIREMALKEIALSLGAQSALAQRAARINKELSSQARTLDKVFDFNALVLEHNVLPPVLLEGRRTLNLADTQTIRVSNRTYKVAKQARFITAAPNWRQYLWMDFKQPEMPNVTLLPKTREERYVWQTYIEQGWKNGIEQANTILEEGVARIKEDFNGMILYRKLLAMNMVSPPYVSNVNLGITGNASEIHIDDRVLRITALPGLNLDSQQWRAALSKDEDTLEKLDTLEQKAKGAEIVITNQAWQPLISPVL
ncbi:MAG: type IV secretion system DotC family protein [Legionellaceae bacterium]|nr:type IV secretion system DotC family protein [Legionellaceae bacterium]